MTRSDKDMGDYQLCLFLMSTKLTDYARQSAAIGNNRRAMRALALAEAKHNASLGDRVGKRLALADAKFLRRAERRGRMVPAE